MSSLALLFLAFSSFASVLSESDTHCGFRRGVPEEWTSPLGRLVDGSGEDASYLPGSNCTWIVRPSGTFESITLVFEKFKLATNRDYLFLHGRDDGREEALGLYTGMLPTPMAVRIEAPEVHLQFLSGSEHAMDDGFDILYLAGNQCYKNCNGALDATCIDGLCHCPPGHYGADCSIHAEELILGQKTIGEVGVGDGKNIKYYQVEVPSGSEMRLLVEMEVLDEEGLARPTLLIGNATNVSKQDPNFLHYKMQRPGECGSYPGCWWSPAGQVNENRRPPSAAKLTTNGPVVDFEMAGTSLLDRYATFPHAMTRVSALPTYTFFSMKDYEASSTNSKHHSIYLSGGSPGNADGSIPLLTAGTWIVGVLNAPDMYSGIAGATKPFSFAIQAQLESNGEPLCSWGCNGSGVCTDETGGDPELNICQCSSSIDGLMVLGDSCKDQATRLDIGEGFLPEALSVGGWEYFYLDIPEETPSNKSIAIEIAYSNSPLAAPRLYVTKGRHGLPSPDVLCRDTQGSGPYDALSCDVSGYGPVLSYSTGSEQDMQREHLTTLIYPEYRFYDEIQQRDPVKRFYVGVFNHHGSAQEKLQYAIMASWVDAGMQPCPFNCGDHGTCIAEEGKCECASNSEQDWVGDYCQNPTQSLDFNVPVHEVLQFGRWKYYVLDVESTTAIVLELTKQEEAAFPYLFVSANGVPKLTAHGQLVNDGNVMVLHDDKSYFCAGMECTTQYVHRLAFRATPGRYYVSVHNGAFSVEWAAMMPSSTQTYADLPTDGSMTYSLIARTSDSPNGIPCYGSCSGHGVCGENAPSCTCEENHFGPDCGVVPTALSVPEWPVSETKSGTLMGGHFDYYVIEIAKGITSFVVEISQPFFGDAEGVLLLAKDRLPSWCSPTTACQQEYDVISQPVHSDYTTTNRVVVYERTVSHAYKGGERNANMQITPEGRWYVAVHNKALGSDKLQYTLRTYAKQGSIECVSPTCSGHGTCDDQKGTCVCESGFLLEDCSATTIDMSNQTTFTIDRELYPRKGLYFSVPVKCDGKTLEVSVTDSTGRPFDGATIYEKKGELPWVGETASYDNAEAGTRVFKILNVEPGKHYVEVYIRENSLRPLPVGSTISINLKPSGLKTDHNQCEYDSGTYYLKAEGSKSKYKVLSPGSNALVEQEAPFVWSYNYRTMSGNVQDGPIGEADYGQCGNMQANGKSCYFWTGRDESYPEPGYGAVVGELAVGLSKATSTASSYHYLGGHMHKFPGKYDQTDYSEAYDGVYKDFQLLYEFDSDTSTPDLAVDMLACNPLLNAANMSGKVCLVARGSCNFSTKTKHCQDAGAISTIIVDADSHNSWALLNVAAGAGVNEKEILIPTLTTGVYVGNKLLAMLGYDDVSDPYSNRVTVSLGQYVCSGADTCSECAHGHFGNQCELNCPGLSDDFSSVCSGHGRCMLDSTSEQPQCMCERGYVGKGCDAHLPPPEFVQFPKEQIRVTSGSTSSIPIKAVSGNNEPVILELLDLPKEMQPYINLDGETGSIQVKAPETDDEQTISFMVLATDSEGQTSAVGMRVVFLPSNQEGQKAKKDNPVQGQGPSLGATEEGSDGDSLSAGAIAGIVIGCVVAAFAMGAAVFVVVARRKKAAAVTHLVTNAGPDMLPGI